jgi:hypothetical protein
MPDSSHSPDDIIDPRWGEYLHSEGLGGMTPHQGSSSGDLGDQMRAIIEPWQAGRRSTLETLEALRKLADQSL